MLDGRPSLFFAKVLRLRKEREAGMRAIVKLLGGALFFGLAFFLALVPQPAASRSSQGTNTPQAGTDEPVPAYHAQAPQGALTTTMAPELFSDPMVQNA